MTSEPVLRAMARFHRRQASQEDMRPLRDAYGGAADEHRGRPHLVDAQ